MAGGAPNAPSSPPSQDARVEITAYEPERIAMRVSTDRPRLLVVSEVAYPGWSAAIDGKDSEILTANYAFRGVVVPPGATRVVMRYEPRSMAIGGLISVFSLGLILLALRRAD